MLFGLDVLRALEHHVLEEVREAGAARLLVLRADVIPELQVHDRRRVILGQDHRQAVRQRGDVVLQLRRPDGGRPGHARCRDEQERGQAARRRPSHAADSIAPTEARPCDLSTERHRVSDRPTSSWSSSRKPAKAQRWAVDSKGRRRSPARSRRTARGRAAAACERHAGLEAPAACCVDRSQRSSTPIELTRGPAIPAHLRR